MKPEQNCKSVSAVRRRRWALPALLLISTVAWGRALPAAEIVGAEEPLVRLRPLDLGAMSGRWVCVYNFTTW